MSLETNPFAVLSLIAGPAILTNASSVLALGTSNRFGRANDRARALSTELERTDLTPELADLRLRQLDRAERRLIFLVNALAAFYMAVGCFAAASLVSAIGSGLAMEGFGLVSRVALYLGVVVGIVGVGSVVVGSFLLLRETRLAVMNLQEEAQFVRKRRDARLTVEDTSDREVVI